jgi:hypothetical protein
LESGTFYPARAAASYRIPATYSSRQAVEAGGLMAYDADRVDMYRQVQRQSEYRALHFGGLSAGLWVGIGRLSGSPKLRSTSNAACIQVFAISNNIWRCLSDLVSAAQRKQSCANSRYSSGDAAMARAFRVRIGLTL